MPKPTSSATVCTLKVYITRKNKRPAGRSSRYLRNRAGHRQPGIYRNLGVELALSWRDQIGDWNYNVGANLTTIKNKVLSLVQDGYSIIAGDKSQSYTMAGYPIGYFYGYKVEGVYQTQEEINSSPKNTLATVTPGDLKFKDVNGDGEITTADRTMIGDPTPNVTYGITLGVGYKTGSWQ